LSVITLPGVYSVIVPPPSVVVVVVVDVLDVCAHANGATTANAMLSIVFFTANPFPLWIPSVRFARRLLLVREGGARFPLDSDEAGGAVPDEGKFA
jgi:hypothetical protein